MNDLGLPLAKESVLDAPASIIIGGEAGVGKTVAVAAAVDPKTTLWITSSGKVLHAVAQLATVNQALADAAGFRVPEDRIVIPATMPGDPDATLSNRALIRDVMIKLAKAKARPYRNIVFANWDVFLSRIFDEFVAEMKIRRKSGEKLGQLDHIIEVKKFAAWIYDVCRANGFNGIFEVNERSPKFDMDEDSPTKGQMVARRGPNMPVYTMIESMVNDADAYIRLTKTITGARSWQTTSTHDTWAKLRGFSTPPFVEIPKGVDGKPRRVEDLSLPELLTLAGYKL